MRGPVTGRLSMPITLLIAAALVVVDLGPAAASQPDAIVFAGLRPASDRSYSKTEIPRLSEAQRLRTMLEELTRDLTQKKVINHAALRAALGEDYLVDFVECRSNVKCVSAILTEFRDDSAVAVYGDYSMRRGRYFVRMRIVNIASASLLGEVEFTVQRKEIEDRERWRRELSVLFAAVDGILSGTGEDDGDENAAENSGELASGADEAAGDHNVGELTDADFGMAAEPGPPLESPAARTISGRTDVPFVEASVGLQLLRRNFTFESEPGLEASRPDGFDSAWTSRVSGAVAIYPLSWLEPRHLAGLGLLAGYGRTLSDTSESSSLRDERLYLGLGYRIGVGRSATYPTFELSAAFFRREAVVSDPSGELPGTTYQGAALGGEVRMPIATPKLAINAALRYLLTNEAGEIVEPAYYGRSKVGGIDIDVSLELRPHGPVFVRVGASYSSFDLELGTNGERSDSAAAAARDQFLSGTVSTGVFL